MSGETVVGPTGMSEPWEPAGALVVATRHRIEFRDLTDAVAERVARSGVDRGLVLVQSHHTTTAMVVNENERRLLEDFLRLLECWAPTSDHYRHDDLHARPEAPPGERPNGAAHARALLLGSSRTLGIAGGELVLGRWQRILMLELDGPRRRTVSIHVVGGPAPEARR